MKEKGKKMSERILVGTRKGLFDLRRKRSGWEVEKVHFIGDPVTAVLDHDGTLHAALDLGHFGVKLWASGVRWNTRSTRMTTSTCCRRSRAGDASGG